MATHLPTDTRDAFVAQLIDMHMDYDFYCEPDGCLITANERGRQLFALTEEMVEGYAYLAQVHPDDAAAVEQHWQHLLTDATPQSIQYRLVLPDDSLRQIQWTSRLITDGDDRVAIQHVGRDVTAAQQQSNRADERMRSHNLQLERLLRRVEAILNGTVDGVALLNIDGGIEQVNLSLQTMVGRDMDNLYGQSLLDIVHPDDSASVEAALMSVQEADDTASVEARLHPADDAPFYAEFNFSKLDNVPMDGTLLLCNIHDVTPYKAVEQSLKTSEARLRLLFESVPDGLVLTDSNARIVDLNRAASIFIDSPTEAVIGKPYTALMPPDLRQQFADAHLIDKLGKYPRRSLEFTYSAPTKQYHLQLTTYPLEIQHDLYFLTIVRDITTIKSTQLDLLAMLEQQHLLNNEKWRFATTTSHEFRTPLATIHATTEILRNYHERLSPEQREQRFNKITEQITHMTQILDDLLALESLEYREPLQPIPVDIHTLVDTLVADIQMHSPAHQIEVHLPPPPFIVETDQKLLRRILNNALANAVNYSDDMTPIILSITYADNELRLSVQDYGIGIPPDEREDIFKLFYRGSNATHHPGTGVGLAIIHRAVQVQGGSVSIQSELGVGTTLAITLPISAIDN